METKLLVQGLFGSKFLSIYNRCEVMAVWSRNTLKNLNVWGFVKKTTPYGKFVKILFRKDSSRHRSTCYVQISWNLADGNRQSHVLLVLLILDRKKNKISPGSPALATARIALKISRGQPPQCAQCAQSVPGFIQIGSLSVNLYPNTWTPSKRVVCMFPIFGWNLASSRIINSAMHSFSCQPCIEWWEFKGLFCFHVLAVYSETLYHKYLVWLKRLQSTGRLGGGCKEGICVMFIQHIGTHRVSQLTAIGFARPWRRSDNVAIIELSWILLPKTPIGLWVCILASQQLTPSSIWIWFSMLVYCYCLQNFIFDIITRRWCAVSFNARVIRELMVAFAFVYKSICTVRSKSHQRCASSGTKTSQPAE